MYYLSASERVSEACNMFLPFALMTIDSVVKKVKEKNETNLWIFSQYGRVLKFCSDEGNFFKLF